MFNFKTFLFLLACASLSLAQVFRDKEEVYEIIENFVQDIRDKSAKNRPEERAREDAQVTIKNGTLQGVVGLIPVLGTTNKFQYAYRHIPFAAPPVGQYRFEPPRPFLEGFGDQIYDATRYSPACAQYLVHIQPASEDCLYLNVYTNRPSNSTDTTLRPVMVYLHGGAFIIGETSVFDGMRLLAEDIILVIPAYRLSVFGFFSTGDAVVPGNMALKDVVQSLRWIQENIREFGGDPDQVTLSGESGGSALASYVHLSPLAKGLFNKVLLMSGVANSEWAIDRNPRESADILAESLNCTTSSTSTQAMVDCLRTIDMDVLARVAQGNLIDRVLSTFRIELPGKAPVIEHDHPGAFITEDPLKILQESDDLPDYPVMLGSVQHEGVLPMAIAVYMVGQPWGLVRDPHWLHHDMISQFMSVYGVDDSRDGGTLSQTVALSFFPDSPRNDFDEMAEGMLDMFTVAFMKAPILRKTEILSQRSRNVYLYSFEHYSQNSLWNFLEILLDIIFLGQKVEFKTGVMHGDDQMYMFYIPSLFNAADRNVAGSYVKVVGNFVKYGNPTPNGAIGDIPEWPAYDLTDKHYLKIKNPPIVSKDYSTSWRQGVPDGT